MGEFHDRPLRIAKQQQVCPGVQKDGSAHLFAPVIVMGDAPQAGFYAAYDDGHIAECFTYPLAVHRDRAVWPVSRTVARGVGVIVTLFFVRGVMVDHGVHVARGYAHEQIGSAQGFEGLGAAPVGLGDYADSKPLSLQHAPYNGHAETRMVHIGVAGDDNHVTAVPTQLLHFRAGGGQKRRGPKTLGPKLPIPVDGGWRWFAAAGAG